uniref:Splicing factor U2af large subunit n=1 Tax=Polytomella parva TaxID=51329 RepID=A0A7S0USS5_9CHLO|mmetsp:Transcript_2/g.2  ORF Transcript_2/g.2 Transcript_2/m.2 type:complete len:489 (+) Transcript_2:82-1548(+)
MRDRRDDRDRDGDRGRSTRDYRDKDRSQEENRSSKGDRDSDKDRDRLISGEGERQREAEGDYDRERTRDRYRRRSRSPRRRRSESPEWKPRPRMRPTLFDVKPSNDVSGQISGPLTVGPIAQNQIISAAAPVLAAFSAATMGNMSSNNSQMPVSQQATRHARRIYVGGLPPSAQESSIAAFFSNALAAIGGNTAGHGNSVLNVYINREKSFSFVEFRTIEETSNAMALDNVVFEGVNVRVKRPNDYNAAVAGSLGPTVPNRNLNLAAVGLPQSQASASAADAHERIFVGGLPYHMTEDQCREMLGAFGVIKSFDLVKDKEKGTSRGYAFVVYQDPNVTDMACKGLNAIVIGDRTLTVRRAAEGQMTFPGSGVLSSATPPAAPLPPSTQFLVLTDALEMEDLMNNEDYEDVLLDMREEVGRYGQVIEMRIPRPTPADPNPPGLLKVIIVFADEESAARARSAIHGRRFGGKVVSANFISAEAFANEVYN